MFTVNALPGVLENAEKPPLPNWVVEPPPLAQLMLPAAVPSDRSKVNDPPVTSYSSVPPRMRRTGAVAETRSKFCCVTRSVPPLRLKFCPPLVNAIWFVEPVRIRKPLPLLLTGLLVVANRLSVDRAVVGFATISVRVPPPVVNTSPPVRVKSLPPESMTPKVFMRVPVASRVTPATVGARFTVAN